MCGERCAGCLWARERYAMSALLCFLTSKAKLKKKNPLAPAVPLSIVAPNNWANSLDALVAHLVPAHLLTRQCELSHSSV